MTRSCAVEYSPIGGRVPSALSSRTWPIRPCKATRPRCCCGRRRRTTGAQPCWPTCGVPCRFATTTHPEWAAAFGTRAAWRATCQINASGTAIYVQGGWYDDLREQGFVTYTNLVNEKHIVIGPWGHCRNDDFDLLSEMHRFFDHHLKGIDSGLLGEDPIHYFTINAPVGREWRSAKSWPVADARPTAYYLAGHSQAGGDLAPQSPKGAHTQTTFAVRYDVDCPTLIKRPDGLLTGAPPCPLAHAGPHFMTSVLKSDTEITGDPVADLWVSSTAADGNFFVYLEDVAADGKVIPVTDGRLKASLRKLDTPRYDVMGLPWHRSYREDAEPLVPGRPARLVFNLLPTSYIFRAGHRIQISIAGADYRERDRTPAAPAPVVTLYGTPANPSFVTLPIVKTTQ